MIKLYQDLVITSGVWGEAVEEGKKKGKPDAFIIEKKIKEKIVSIHKSKPSYPEMKLGNGETETIHEAIDESVPAMIEDIKPRIIGAQLGLDVVNLPLILIKAFLERKWTEVEYEDALQKYAVQMSPSAEQLVFLRNIKDLIKKSR
jgi:predicted nucleic acid-binding protein